MGHIIHRGPHPNLMVMEVIERLNYEDMTAEEELELHKGKPVYVLLDVSNMDVGLPEYFLDGARKSYFMHENMAHLALYTNSVLLRSIGNMVAKLTRRQERLSVHETYESAEAHLLKLIEQANIPG